jgi:galacturonokinase
VVNPLNLDKLKSEVESRYGVDPDTIQVVRSPYRICPMGAHIDHQLGPVTAMAIDRAVYLAFAPSGSSEVRLASQTFNGEVSFSTDNVPSKDAESWANYACGAIEALRSNYTVDRGIVGVTTGQINEGGLSSSAAIGVAYLLAFETVNELEVTPEQNIELDRLIENEYLGLRNGILDQSAILLSRDRNLTVIDCKTVSHRLVPRSDTMPPFSILVAYSGVKDALVSTGYNTRVDECAKAARLLLDAVGRSGEKPLLGNITPDEYEEHENKLSGDPAKRAKHFFTESARVYEGIAAWERGDLKEFGRLVTESGKSSVENYESGSPPLIDLYNILVETDGVYGARFSGGGFRGCSIALVDPEKAESAARHIESEYAARQPERAAQSDGVLICHSADGAGIVKIENA